MEHLEQENKYESSSFVLHRDATHGTMPRFMGTCIIQIKAAASTQKSTALSRSVVGASPADSPASSATSARFDQKVMRIGSSYINENDVGVFRKVVCMCCVLGIA